ncbi:MAG: UDP-3-O-(3-hydroxymyristoyl)glucosamine N-acyltransferase [Candidatus Krumholzibacteriia bacterium]
MGTLSYSLKELAELVGGALSGDGSTRITGVAGIKEAGSGEITFLANTKYRQFLSSTRASAVIGPREIECALPSIRLEDPYLGFLKVVTMFAERARTQYPRGQHPTAIVDKGARLGANVSIGPYCQIEAGARIGDNSVVLRGGYVGANTAIGESCLIYPNVTIREGCEIGSRVIIHPGAVVGSDGFGFAKDGETQRKIPHIGIVVIGDDVEIGANTTIDRATTGVTRIGGGTKIDNLVQIAHNVTVGKNCIMAAQVGISGSAELGEGVVIGGQAGLVGHIVIGDGVVIAAQAGVTKSIPAGTTVSGYPAREHAQARKLYGFTTRLPELYRKIQELARKVAQLEKGKGHDTPAEDDR